MKKIFIALFTVLTLSLGACMNRNSEPEVIEIDTLELTDEYNANDTIVDTVEMNVEDVTEVAE